MSDHPVLIGDSIRIFKNFTQNNIFADDIGYLFESAIEVNLGAYLPLKSIGNSLNLTYYVANNLLRLKLIDDEDEPFLTPIQALNQLKLDSLMGDGLNGRVYRPWAALKIFISKREDALLYDDFDGYYLV